MSKSILFVIHLEAGSSDTILELNSEDLGFFSSSDSGRSSMYKTAFVASQDGLVGGEKLTVY